MIKSSGPLSPAQRRSAVNERIPSARQMIELSGIKLRRDCGSTNAEHPEIIEIDVLEQIFDLTRLGINSGKTVDVIDESIGVYQRDQRKARRRTWNPLFWLSWSVESIVEALIQIIGWIAEIPIRLISRIFRLDQERAFRAWYGRLITGICTFLGTLAALAKLVEFLGWKDTVLRWLKLH